MGGDAVEHDGKGEDVGCHAEDEENDLTEAEEFAAKRPKEDHACVGHVVHVRVAHFELPYHVAGVGGEEAENENEDKAARRQSVKWKMFWEVRENALREAWSCVRELDLTGLYQL